MMAEVKAVRHRAIGISTAPGGGQFGFSSQASLQVSGGTNSNNVYPASYKSAPTNETAGLGNFSHYLAQQITNQSGGTITNQRVFDCSANLTDTATNTYAFIGRLNEGSNTNYNFVALGTAQNYFAGKVGIGTNSPQELLHVEGNIQVADNATIGTTSGSMSFDVDQDDTAASQAYFLFKFAKDKKLLG